jgi:hypothetical protein
MVQLRATPPTQPDSESDDPYKSLRTVISLLTKSEGLTSTKSIMSQLQNSRFMGLEPFANSELTELQDKLGVGKGSGHRPNVPVYNKKTAVEFHCLLVALFLGYGKALAACHEAAIARRKEDSDHQQLKRKKAQKQGKTASADQATGDGIGDHLAKVWTYGRLLWRVTSSQMFDDHLETLGRISTFSAPISSLTTAFLDHVRFGMQVEPGLDVGAEGDVITEEEDVEEEIRRGTAEKTTVGIRAAQLFKNWTYLNTSYFAALRVLVGSVKNNPTQEIRASFIVMNHFRGHNHDPMDWCETIRSLCLSREGQPSENSMTSSNREAEAHGPLQLPSSEDPQPLAATTPFSPKDAEKAIQLLQSYMDERDPQDLKIISSFGRNEQKSPAQSDNLGGTETLALTGDGNRTPLAQSNDGSWTPLTQSDDGNRTPLAKSGGKKGLGVGKVAWIGNPHCEAVAIALICFLTAAIPDPKNPIHTLFPVGYHSSSSCNHWSDCVQPPLDVTGFAISKLCCPICWELLQILRGSSHSFMVRGYHTSFYPVELPSWLPVFVLEDMVRRFEEHLRRELVIFLGPALPGKKTHKIVESFDSVLSYSSASSLSETTGSCESDDHVEEIDD